MQRYETDERRSRGKKFDRVRGTREGGFLGAAVEKIEGQRKAPDDFFGHRKRANKCNAFVRGKRRRGRIKRKLFRRSGLNFQEGASFAENLGHRKRANKCKAFVRKARRSWVTLRYSVATLLTNPASATSIQIFTIKFYRYLPL